MTGHTKSAHDSKLHQKVLVLGAGLSRVAPFLQSQLDLKCPACFVVIGPSDTRGFTTEIALSAKALLSQHRPDLVVFYDSGAFLAHSIFESFFYEFDEDSYITHKPLDTVSSLPCCSAFIPETARERIGTIYNFSMYIRQTNRGRNADFKLSDGVMRSLAYLAWQTTQEYKAKFLVLYAPHKGEMNQVRFLGTAWERLIFRILTSNYLPNRIRGASLYKELGIPILKMPIAIKDLYQGSYTEPNQLYTLNDKGLELWSQSASEVLWPELRGEL